MTKLTKSLTTKPIIKKCFICSAEIPVHFSTKPKITKNNIKGKRGVKDSSDHNSALETKCQKQKNTRKNTKKPVAWISSLSRKIADRQFNILAIFMLHIAILHQNPLPNDQITATSKILGY